MAEAAKELGHAYWALTDHSPRLTVAHGLNAERLREQLEVVDELNEELAPFRILTGIEVDILEDGSLDQDDELLARLDVVVASVHSKLRMEAPAMTSGCCGPSRARTPTFWATAPVASWSGERAPASRASMPSCLRGVRPNRHGGRDQLATRASRSARGPAALALSLNCVHDGRHRRPCTRAARVAALRLREGRLGRSAGGAHHERAPDGGVL
jgi:putative hydrolase